MNASLKNVMSGIYRKRADAVPKGWKRTSELAQEWEVSERRAVAVCNEAVKAGLMERKVFRVMGREFLIRVPHYREVKGK